LRTGAMLTALRIAGIYTLLGALWISASDRLVTLIVSDPLTAAAIQTYKGWSFVLVSGLIIYCLLSRELAQRMKTEERLAMAMDGAQLAAWDADLIARTTSRSLRHDRIYGYDSLQPEWNYDIFLAHVLPEDRDHVSECYKRSLTTGELTFDCRIKWPDGSVHWIDARGRVYFDGKGRPIRMVGVVMDATERRQAEKAILASEQMLKRILAASPVGVGLSVNRKMIWVNEAWAGMFGFADASDAVGQLARDVYESEEDYIRAGAALYKDLARGSINEIDTKMVRKDGATFDVCIRMTALDPDDLSAGALAVITDISDRKATEAALEKSEATLRGILQVAQIGMGLVRDRRMDWINPMISQISGYSAEELTGKDARIHYVSEEEYARVGNSIYTDVKEKGIGTVEAQWRHKNGHVVNVLLNAVAMIPGDPSKGVVFTALDVTERKRAEESLRRSEERYRSLFEHMLHGFARCKMVFEDGKPEDFIYLDVNESFEKLTGLKNVVGRKVTEVIPGIRESNPELFDIFGRVSLAGVPEKFETYVDSLGLWFSISVYSNQKNRFVTVFDNVTERKRAEESLRRSEAETRLRNRILEIFLTVPDDQVYADILQIVLEVTESSYGIFGYFSENGAFVVPSLTRDIFWERCLVAEKEVIFDESSFTGIWAHAVESAKTVVRNKGPFRMPEGHVPITNSMVTPIVYQNKIISAIHVANKATDYGESDLRVMETIARSVAPVLNARLERDRKDKERQKAEREVRESEERFRTAFGASPDAVNINRVSDGLYVDVNDGFTELTGFTRDEVIGKSSSEISIWNDPKDRERLVAELRRSGHATNMSLKFRLKDGRVRCGLMSASVIAISGVPHILSITRDIDYMKRAEEERVRLATAIDQAAETVVITDTEGIILYVNPAFEQVTGYSRDQAIGGNPKILKSGLHSRAFYKDLWATIGEGKVWRGHLINRRKDGVLYEEEATISPIKDDSGAIVNYVAVKRDVTQEISLQKQLLHAQKMEAVGTLAGGIAHDFNNLLQVIMGYSELLLQDKNEDTTEHADLKKVFDAAKNGAELVQRLLTFSRKVEPKLVVLNLNRQILQVDKLLKRTIPKMVSIHLDLSPDVADIYGDPTQLEQILMNLAVNARDAMPDGGTLTIGTTNVTVDDEFSSSHSGLVPGEYALLSVTDTGQGMNQCTVEHIFEPFYTTKELGRGTGLGLAMVYGIVNRHGGRITCFSRVGQGSTFKVYFPAIPAEAERDLELSGEMPAMGTETVLLVDDEDAVRDLGERILRGSGYAVLTAANGAEAVELYLERRDEVALVILDVIMPTMGGKECLKALLNIDPHAKVMIASGYSASESERELIGLGAKGFVGKPFRVRELLQGVRNVLDDDIPGDN
jgi:PAS domain S-box-containing protein